MEASLGVADPAGRSLRVDVLAQQVRVRNALVGGAGRRPKHRPNLRAMLDGSLPIPGGLVVGGSIAHLGSQYCVNAETDGDIGLGAQSVAGLDAQRTWSFGRGSFRSMRLLFGADNLLDAAVYEQCGLPRAGRTLRVDVEFR